MNVDQLFGREHKKAFRREQNFPIYIKNQLTDIDNKTQWLCNASKLHDLLLSAKRNKSLWGFNVMDAVSIARLSDKNQIDKLSEHLNFHNNTLTIITDNFNINGNLINYLNDNIKIVTIPELLGLAYIEYEYKSYYTHKKLYNAFMQRTQEDRLRLFVELNKRKLINDGYVSYLGIISLGDNHNSITDRRRFVMELLKTIEYDALPEIPYKNFEEPKGNFTDLEEECKYSVVLETYNNDELYQDWIVFTEKTLRALQVPNISIIANTRGYLSTLESYGFQLHTVNQELDRLTEYDKQSRWIGSFLSNDSIQYNATESIAIAKHNTNILKQYSEYIETPHFINKIRDHILMWEN